jgi:hypothetical protein
LQHDKVGIYRKPQGGLRLGSFINDLFLILVKRITFSDINGFHRLNYWLHNGFRNFHSMRPFRGYRTISRRSIGSGWGGVEGYRRS